MPRPTSPLCCEAGTLARSNQQRATVRQTLMLLGDCVLALRVTVILDSLLPRILNCSVNATLAATNLHKHTASHSTSTQPVTAPTHSQSQHKHHTTELQISYIDTFVLSRQSMQFVRKTPVWSPTCRSTPISSTASPSAAQHAHQQRPKPIRGSETGVCRESESGNQIG